MTSFVMSARHQHEKIYAWDIAFRNIPHSRLATFLVNGGDEPPQLARDLLIALNTGQVRTGEGHKSKVNENRIYE